MAFNPTIVLLVLAIFSSTFKSSDQAESHAEMYWKTKLDNIPMPQCLKMSLQTGANDGPVRLNSKYIEQANGDHDMQHFATYEEDYTLHGNLSQVHQDDRVIYFTNDKLRAGTTMMLHLKKIYNDPKFLPLNVAKLMSATTDKLQVMLNILSVDPKSILAQDIEKTVKKCGEKGVKNEERHCVNLLEDMVDYVTLKSGNNKLLAIATEQGNGKVSEYTFQNVQQLGFQENNNIVCHKMNHNPFVVFLCHNIKSTNVYEVSMVGADEKHTKAVVACHMDTSTWNPRNYVFQYLKTKPGGEPVCHFVSADVVAWLPKKNGS